MLQPAWQTTQMSNKFDVLHSEQAGKTKGISSRVRKAGLWDANRSELRKVWTGLILGGNPGFKEVSLGDKL